MKKIFFILLLAPLFFGACSSDDDDDVLSVNKVRIPIATDALKQVEIGLQGNQIVINWGDGTTETTENLVELGYLTHTYKTAGAYNVEITTDNLEALDIKSEAGTIGDVSIGLSPKLRILHIEGSSIANISTQNYPNLQVLGIWSCPNLKQIDVSKNSNLYELSITDTKLEALDITNNPRLIRLACVKGMLTSLNLSKNIQLDVISCSDNLLTSLDVSKIPELNTLRCDRNKLISMDVSQNLKLGWLYLYENPNLGTLKISNEPNMMLQIIQIEACNFSAESLNSIFTALPVRSVGLSVIAKDNPGFAACDKTIATKKGWIVG